MGLGFLVSPELALTCAHVVSAALGTPLDQGPPADARLHVDLPLLAASGSGGTDVTASIDTWLPPQETGGGDVAVLRLDSPLPGAVPIRLVEDDMVWDHPVRAFGFPAGRPGGVWHSGVLRAEQSQGLLQVDLTGTGYPVSRGFSGTPVWDEDLGGVVGMMAVAESGQPSASYLIPTASLRSSSPELRGLTLPPSPFRSLKAFQESDAPLFYGRQAESGELARALAGERWVTLVGASGAGKSSLALAGVVPRLRKGGAVAVVVRPTLGSSPLAALAAVLLPMLEPELSETQRLLRLSELTEVLRQGGLADLVPRLLELRNSRRLLVVVDQFEELLALTPQAVGELADVLFADALPRTVRVLTTLRADFLEIALAHPRLGPALSRRVHALGPLSPERLREVVTAPVDAIPGVRYESALVDRILEDTGTEPGALPLLGFTLDLLWQEQRSGLLTHQAYRDLGGVTGALSAHADQAWNEHVPKEDEPAARRLFTQLIRVPMGSPAATRRMALRTELGEQEWRIAQQLAVTRLLVTGLSAEGVETVELTHEALISGWEKLAVWAAEDRTFLEWRESLRHDMDRWERAERSPELLPTNVALAAAQAWATEHDGDLTTAERAYLDSGRTYRRSQARWVRLRQSVVTVFTVAVVTFAMLFAYARQQSQEREALATSRALTQASQDEASTDPARSVMLALAAYQTSPTQEARNQLLRTYLMHSNKSRMISGLLGTVRTFQMSLDGNVVLATSKTGRATLFVHAITGDVRIAQVPSVGQVEYPLVSADGKRAGYVQEDGKAAWFPVDQDGDQPMGELHRLPEALGTAVDANKGLGPTMSLDGTRIVARVLDNLIWWDLDSGTIARSTPAPADDGNKDIDALWIGPDNRSLLLLRSGWGNGNTALHVYDPATGATRVVVTDVDQISLSGDRTAAVVCRQSQPGAAALSLIRISDGAQQGEPYSEQDKRFNTGTCLVDAVSATGGTVGIWHSDTLSVVDLLRNKVLSRTPAKSAVSSRQLVSAAGKLFYVTWEGSLITYTDLAPGGGVLQIGQQGLTNDGTRTISVLADGSAIQLRPATGDNSVLLAEAARRKPYWKPGDANQLRLNGDGSLLASQEGQNVISVRETSTLREVAVITAAEPPPLPTSTPSILGPAEPAGDAAKWDFHYYFDAGGNVLTVSGTVVQQWDSYTGRELARFDAKALQPKDAPEGRPHISIGPYPAPNKVDVVTWGDPDVRIVDITTGAVTETVRTTEDVLAVQFDRSGRYFGLMRRGSIVELWRRDPLRRELGPLRSTAEDLITPTVTRFIDRDGRFVIAANNAVRIYRVGERAPQDSFEFGEPPGSASNRSYSFMDISKDGSTVIYVDPSGTGGPLRLDPRMWQRDLCKIIGYRQFTDDERASLPARVPAQPLCAEREA
ncbi:trypsin-like peptidase domain-containing protein [Streptomyces sp. NPDC056224]|uniref:nSTAND1 domain-containing NTPase n=1 Tax=Streptomyces sp. NPDC056224 TaxID=3345750 RepID=UPI0035E2B79C